MTTTFVAGETLAAAKLNTAFNERALAAAPAEAVATHVAATDPHGDRAYTDMVALGLAGAVDNWDATAGTFPATGGNGAGGAVAAGDAWLVSTEGTIAATLCPVGTILKALTDTPGQTAGNWAIKVPSIDRGTADVAGPSSATDNHFAMFAGSTGKQIKDGGISLDTDSTMAANSDARVASQKAAKSAIAAAQAAAQSYADSLVVGLWDDRGNYDASSNTFPSSGGSGSAGAIKKGDIWTISVAGSLGGAAINIGDTVRALVDSPGSTASNWAIAEGNLGYTPERQDNKSTDAETDKTSDTKYPSVKAIVDWVAARYAALAGFTMSGAISMAGNLINQPKLKDFREALGTASISGGVLTLDFSTGSSFAVTLTENITSVVCSNVPATGQMVPMVVELTQDGTGGRTVIWGSAYKFPVGTVPTITATAGAVDIVGGYTRDGGTTWRLARAHTDSK